MYIRNKSCIFILLPNSKSAT